jgi:predicted tellurium resistance membrane protein TerC
MSVTELAESPEDERRRRMTKYTMAMTIRTVCVILIVILPSPWLWLAALGAIFLPYFAVVIANQQSISGKDGATMSISRSIEK